MAFWDKLLGFNDSVDIRKMANFSIPKNKMVEYLHAWLRKAIKEPFVPKDVAGFSSSRILINYNITTGIEKGAHAALNNNGMKVLDRVTLPSSDWEETVDRLLKIPAGYYYFSLRPNGGFYPMAAFTDGWYLFFLIPNKGLYVIEKQRSSKEALVNFFRSIHGDKFGIVLYRVDHPDADDL